MAQEAAAARRSKGAVRERQVLQAAVEVLSQQGHARLTLADVATRAGMSVGHVTYYFPSKTELLLAAIRHSEDAFQAEVDTALARVHDPWRRLECLVGSAAPTGQGDPGWVLWFHVWAQAATEPAVAELQTELADWWYTRLDRIVAEGMQSGAFGSPDPEQACTVLAGLVDGLSAHLTLGRGDLSRDRVIGLVMDTARQLLTPS
jgi:AcrR family transcriptional regulator